MHYMKSRTFRLEESDIELLKQLADSRGVSQSDAIRYAIRSATQNEVGALHGEIPKNEQVEHGEVVSELIRQLKVKDEQITALNQALVNAQETAKAAQVLQAKATMGELSETAGDVPEQPRRSWWQRLFG